MSEYHTNTICLVVASLIAIIQTKSVFLLNILRPFIQKPKKKFSLDLIPTMLVLVVDIAADDVGFLVGYSVHIYVRVLLWCRVFC